MDDEYDGMLLHPLSEKGQQKLKDRFNKTIKDIESKGFKVNIKSYPYVMKHIESGKKRKLLAMDINDNVDELIAMFWDESGGSEVLGGISPSKMPEMMANMFKNFEEKTGYKVNVVGDGTSPINHILPKNNE